MLRLTARSLLGRWRDFADQHRHANFGFANGPRGRALSQRRDALGECAQRDAVAYIKGRCIRVVQLLDRKSVV